MVLTLGQEIQCSSQAMRPEETHPLCRENPGLGVRLGSAGNNPDVPFVG